MKPKPKNALRWAAYGAFIGAAYIILVPGNWSALNVHWGFAGGQVFGGALAGAVMGGGAAAIINFFSKG